MENIGKFNWNYVRKETISDAITRQMIYGENTMIARLEIKKGAVVPEHNHESEQITWITRGMLKFKINGKDIYVKEGESLIIPSNVKHEAIAMDDTVDIDIFSPVRKDWINGDDTYLRKRS